VVDLVNDLHVSWKEVGNKINRPFLECLWQDCVVGIGEGMINDLPCAFERKLLLVNQNTEQFDSGNGWMSIVKLNLILA
jgi:hypothetical protein